MGEPIGLWRIQILTLAHTIVAYCGISLPQAHIFVAYSVPVLRKGVSCGGGALPSLSHTDGNPDAQCDTL